LARNNNLFARSLLPGCFKTKFVTILDAAPCVGGMTKTIVGSGLSLFLFLATTGACEKTDDPCDSEGNNYSPFKCALGIDDRPVCKEDDPPWKDCRREVYRLHELGVELGIDAAEAGRLLESEGYIPEHSDQGELKYWLDAEALESLAQLTDPDPGSLFGRDKALK
jgi:hypothetical protein